MTDESQEITESEASNQEECKEVALRIFEDACVLYDGERYRGALYLSGYVIENGIKSELYRLGSKPAQPDQLASYIKTLLNDYCRQHGLKPIVNVEDNLCLSNIEGLLDVLRKIIAPLIVKEAKSTSEPKALKNYFYHPNELVVHHETRAMINKRASATDESNRFHDMTAFLKQLEYWITLLEVNEDGISLNDYNIIGWKSSLRYSIPNSNYNIPEQERAEEALKRAYSFLRQVVYKHDSFLQNNTAIRVVNRNFSPADEVNTITTSSNTNME